MALGAEPGRVLRLMSRQGLVITCAGLRMGGLPAFGASRVLEAFLFGVDAQDLLVFLVMPLVLLLVSPAAILVPAGRAVKVSPLNALCHE